MIELQHRLHEPNELAVFRAEHPDAEAVDFDGFAFRPAKLIVRSVLNADQGGLCAYCERELSPAGGQIDHIKPKNGPNARIDLCFIYTNYAHSCINERTCGQKKKAGLLPIEPGPGCNDDMFLNTTDGMLEPRKGLTKHRQHEVRQTRDMLGLNADPALVQERKKYLVSTLQILHQAPEEIDVFLKNIPFKHILHTLLT